MDDELLSFEEHRRRRDENASSVRCARCGESILATTTRCPECGVHFQGEAQDYAHSSEKPSGECGSPRWVVAVAVLLLIAMAVGVLGLQ